MKKVFTVLLILIFIVSCKKVNSLNIFSPNKQIKLVFNETKGFLNYSVFYKDSLLIKPSKLGFEFKNTNDMASNFVIDLFETTSSNTTWEQVWGENKIIQNNYNELSVLVHERVQPFRKMKLVFRVFDDGVGFRYVIPKQKLLDSILITNEITEFNFSKNHTAWYTPANYDSYEMLYKYDSINHINDANTPITFKTDDSVYLSIHEANLTNYAGMTLLKNKDENFSFQSNLVPWPNGVKVKAKTPMVTPWRTIQIADKAKSLVESSLILNLNEPNQIENTSWIEPMKYIGIWWGMHLGTHTWTLGEKHGATTKAAKEYIDFAAKNNIKGVLAEGWNTGWENWGKKGAFDFVTPYKDFDLNEITSYATSKKIEFIGHVETGGDAAYFEENLDKVFSMYRNLGVKTIKTGYAGAIQTKGQFHHGQYMVNHYRKVVESAAKYQIMIDAHEPIKPTGIRRTYPNMMTREGARGMEWNAWSSGNPPEHHTILPFTRGLAGPIDYTPGTFDILYKNATNRVKWNSLDDGSSRVNTTLAKQLGLFVILYSPLQMASDLIENYENQPAFNFIKDFATDWEKSIVLNGKIGDYITIARKDKDSDNWFLGSCTDENKRELKIELSFLDADKKYKLEIYADGVDADWKINPLAVEVYSEEVDSKTVLNLKLAPGGGQAIKFSPI